MLGAGSFLFLPRSGRVLRAKWALVAGPASASPSESSALAVYGGISRCAPRASNTLVILLAPGASLWSP